jgi:hypothetical protein
MCPPARPTAAEQTFLKETHMNMIDSTGHPVSGATPDGLAAYEQAARELLCLVDDPAASVARAIEASPEMPMAYALQAWLHLLGTEPEGIAVARAACEAATALPANDRERATGRRPRLARRRS